MPEDYDAGKILEASCRDEIAKAAGYTCSCVFIRFSELRTDGMSSNTTVPAASIAIYSILYHSYHVSAEKPSGAYAPKNITPETTEHMYLHSTPNRYAGIRPSFLAINISPANPSAPNARG